MDIVKAQRLSQNLAIVSDMVAYSDIADYLVESGVVDPQENQCLLGKLTEEGNVMVMNELLTMITLRRGGFDALLKALRKSDYAWLAERLDPGKQFSGGGGVTGSDCSTPDGAGRRPAQKNIMTAISRRISRRSGSILSRPRSRGNFGNEEDKDSGAIFMSYRDDCPIDIPINPSYYTNQGQTEKWIELALESVSISETTDEDASGADAFEILNLDGNTIATSSSTTTTISMTPSRQAVIYNLAPTQLEAGHVEEYITTLAKRANIPSPMIKDLKVLNSVGKISKRKKKQKTKLKIQLKSEIERNLFVNQINQFIQNMKPSDDLYESISHLKVAIPKKKKGRKLIFGGGGKAEADSKNWYQKPFRFQKWKK